MTRLSIALSRAGLLLAAACASTAEPPSSAAPASNGDASGGLSLLDEALRIRDDHSLWEQVAPTADEACSKLQPAAQSGQPRAGEGLAAAQALSTWQAVCEAGWTLDEASDPAAKEAWVSARAATALALLRWLESQPGELSASFAVRALVQLETGRDEGFEAALTGGLQRFPASPVLNDLARAQRDHLAEPAKLADAMAAFASEVQANPEHEDAARIEAQSTQGFLLLAAGLKAEDAGNSEEAIAHYERGGRALSDAYLGGPRRISDWSLRQRLADCYANAGRLRLAAAQAAMAQDGLAAAAPSLQAAETDWTEALAALPDDEECRAGAAATADAWFAGGDMAGARDAFGRLARRFDIAEWWNNTAFLARETGQYEESFAAYEHCLQLEPDNARFVNDTALILLYHLHRDLPRAEQMFRRAIELGRAACDNPFADEAIHEQNFGAWTDAMLNLALLMARDGRLDEAAKQCDELLAIAPERPDAQGLRDRIAAARGGKPFTEPDDSTPAAPRTSGP